MKNVKAVSKEKNMEKIEVIFGGGIAKDGVHGCNYMLARTEDLYGDPIELYSEAVDLGNVGEDETDAFDAATYPVLREDIINQAMDAVIDPDRLDFPFGASFPNPKNAVYVDGKLLYLDIDAQLDNDVYGGVEWCAKAHDSSGREYEVCWDYITPDWYVNEEETPTNGDRSNFADWIHPAYAKEL